ncbi:hypothetical protein [Salinibius halmophilus]|uniref:hypothetical protein n=1 Tax=Salinibius halmophilus TaxID=1853216 RepID=UPI000E666E9E|nr:hypothetical protein [Salinibius halmophilus]
MKDLCRAGTLAIACAMAIPSLASVPQPEPSGTPSVKFESFAGRSFNSFSTQTATFESLAPINDVDLYAGTHDVGNDGSFGYSYQFKFPKSPGMVPQLGIAYNSNNKYGEVGYGWNLTGLEHISRCRQYDVGSVPIDDTGGSWYCMGDKRLVLVSGTANSAGAIYRLSLDQVGRYFKIDSVSAGVPQQWSAHAIDGSVRTFGGTANARIAGYDGGIRSWHLSTVEDALGFANTYDYIKVDSRAYLSSINYGSGTSATNVTLNWSDIRDQQLAYHDGLLIWHRKILDSVVVTGTGVNTQYDLQQKVINELGLNLPNEPHMLTGIRVKYDTDAWQPVADFGYESGYGDIKTYSHSIDTYFEEYYWSGSSVRGWLKAERKTPSTRPKVVVADYDDDGRDEILFFDPDDGNNGFSSAPLRAAGVSEAGAWEIVTVLGSVSGYIRKKINLKDLDGDGRTELILSSQGVSQDSRYTLKYDSDIDIYEIVGGRGHSKDYNVESAGPFGSVWFNPIAGSNTFSVEGECVYCIKRNYQSYGTHDDVDVKDEFKSFNDFNKDGQGRSKGVGFGHYAQSCYLQPYYDGLSVSDYCKSGSTTENESQVVDLNSDGFPDLYTADLTPGGQAALRINDGTGITYVSVSSNDQYINEYKSGYDLDGDGWLDYGSYLTDYNYDTKSLSESYVRGTPGYDFNGIFDYNREPNLYGSIANFSIAENGSRVSVSISKVLGDFNGNGLTEIFNQRANENIEFFAPPKLNRITSNGQELASVTYSHTGDRSVYTPAANDGEGTILENISPRSLVHIVDTPVGRVGYEYAGGRNHRGTGQGVAHGFVGFENVTTFTEFVSENKAQTVVRSTHFDHRFINSGIENIAQNELASVEIAYDGDLAAAMAGIRQIQRPQTVNWYGNNSLDSYFVSEKARKEGIVTWFDPMVGGKHWFEDYDFNRSSIQPVYQGERPSVARSASAAGDLDPGINLTYWTYFKYGSLNDSALGNVTVPMASRIVDSKYKSFAPGSAPYLTTETKRQYRHIPLGYELSNKALGYFPAVSFESTESKNASEALTRIGSSFLHRGRETCALGISQCFSLIESEVSSWSNSQEIYSTKVTNSNWQTIGRVSLPRTVVSNVSATHPTNHPLYNMVNPSPSHTTTDTISYYSTTGTAGYGQVKSRTSTPTTGDPVTVITEPRTVQYTYDAFGNVATETDSYGAKTTYKLPNNAARKPAVIEHPDGLVETFRYSNRGRLVQRSNNRDLVESIDRYLCTDLSMLTEISSCSANGLYIEAKRSNQNGTSFKEFDVAGNEITNIAYTHGNSAELTKREYDQHSTLVAISQPQTLNSLSNLALALVNIDHMPGLAQRTQVGAYGLVKGIHSHSGGYTSFNYNLYSAGSNSDSIIDTNAVWQKTTTVWQTSAKAHKLEERITYFDALNREIGETQITVNRANGENHTVSHKLDALGNSLESKNGSTVLSQTLYNGFGKESASVDNYGVLRTTRYNSFAEPVELKTNGVLSSIMHYDQLGRLTSKGALDGSAELYNYDSRTTRLTSELQQSANGTITKTPGYHPTNGRLEYEDYVYDISGLDQQKVRFKYNYNDNGQYQWLVPNVNGSDIGHLFHRYHDKSGKLSFHQLGLGSRVNYTTLDEYNAYGLQRQTVYNHGAPAGHWKKYGIRTDYSELGLPKYYDVSGDHTHGFTYGYDSRGYLISESYYTVNRTFEYNGPLGTRLSAIVDGSKTNLFYDRFGHIKTSPESVTHSRAPNGQLQGVGGGRYSPPDVARTDDRGRIWQLDNRSFTYDDFDRLTEVVNFNSGRRANYVYMGGKLAVSVDAPSGQGGEKVYTFFLPHGFKYSVVETFANRQRTTKVTHSLSASGINMHYDPSEGTTTQAVLRNHLGNMVAVLASNDTNRIDPYKISPYGLTQNGGNAKTNQLVQDKPQYDNFQIVHFGGRVYDLYSRQFLTPDPIVPNHSNITHWGRYSYGYGNPYGHVDPTGYYQIASYDDARRENRSKLSDGDVPHGDTTNEVLLTNDRNTRKAIIIADTFDELSETIIDSLELQGLIGRQVVDEIKAEVYENLMPMIVSGKSHALFFEVGGSFLIIGGGGGGIIAFDEEGFSTYRYGYFGSGIEIGLSALGGYAFFDGGKENFGGWGGSLNITAVAGHYGGQVSMMVAEGSREESKPGSAGFGIALGRGLDLGFSGELSHSTKVEKLSMEWWF